MTISTKRVGVVGGILAGLVMLAGGLVPAQAKTKFKALYSFTGGKDGAQPQGGLVADSAGNLYGTTTNGGRYNLGTVFKLATSGKETLLHTFAGQGDGATPLYVTLVFDSAGNLYGTTEFAGYGRGVVFKLDSKGKETVLYGLDLRTGAYPFAGVIRDAEGNIYVTTTGGGAEGFGTVFEVTGIGKGKVLHDFLGKEWGFESVAPLVENTKGNLYGTTQVGGGANVGTIFKLSPRNQETVLHAFNGDPDGALPQSGLIMDSEGNLYGTTSSGGGGGGGTYNLGSIYEIDKTGKETVLYGFTGSPDGEAPGNGSLAMDSAGNMYGTTELGGVFGFGTVFKLDTTGKETVLYSFTGGNDGGTPVGGLILDRKGNMYGTASTNGKYNNGTIFRITP